MRRIYLSKLFRGGHLLCLFSLSTLFFLATGNVLANVNRAAEAIQAEPVTGVIKNTAGESLPGVVVKNNANGKATLTNAEGKFTLEATTGDELQITFVGFKTTTVKVDRNVLDIVLENDTRILDEVVVTAIGIKQQKRKLGYSTQEIKTDVLQESKTMNIGNALTGQIAGLNVTNPTGIFQAPSFTLRGKTPLIVIDGIPVETDFFDVPSQNVENINVLKGTAASALYGSRGKNGAILITTRSAREDKLEVNFTTTNMATAGFTVFPKTQTEYGSGSNGQYEFWDGADGGISDGDMTWGPKLGTDLKYKQWNSPIRNLATGEVIQWYGDVAGTIYDDKSKYERVPTDWVRHDNLRDFLRTGFVTENALSLGYKTDRANIFVSGKYAFQRGQVPNSQLSSGGLNINSNYKLTKDLIFDVNLSYNKVASPNYPRYGYGPKNHMYTILLWMSDDVNGKDLRNNFYRIGDEGYRQANYNYAWYNNPYFAAYELTQKYDRDVIQGQSALTWMVNDKFVVKGRASARQIGTLEDMKSPKSYMNYGDSRNGDYKIWNRNQVNFDADVLATYTEEINKNFGFSINAGSSVFTRNVDSLYQSTDGLVVPFVYSLNNTQGPVRAVNALNQKAIRSVYGSVNFDIFGSTYLNVSGRNDWSSTLAASNASYFYPSISLSSVLSDYFTLSPKVDYLKVYTSWASVSNDLLPYNTSAVYTKDVTYGSTPSVSYPAGIINPNILPERSTSIEAGLAFALLKNRLAFDFTYYNVLDENQIIDLSISQAAGFNSRKVNGNQYRTNGFEVMLNAVPVKNNILTWNTAVNWSKYVKRLTAIYGDQERYGNFKVGDRSDAFYTTVWEKSADGKLILNANTGMPIRDSYARNIGHVNPDWQFGFLNTIKVKDFTINVDIDGAFGGIMNSNTIEKMWWAGKHPNSTLHRDAEYSTGQYVFIPEGVVVVSGEVKRDIYGDVISDTREYATFDKAVSWQSWSQQYPYRARVTAEENEYFANTFSRSFVKLRRVSVSYDLNKLLKINNLNGLTASVFGYNLAMWKKIPYIDPDFKLGNDSDLQDPSSRYIGLSLNFKF
jgi:TonB-linked SusC/RagA family outer membrane protein